MDKLESFNMDYSQLTSDEIKDIKEVEEKINENRTQEVILLAVESK